MATAYEQNAGVGEKSSGGGNAIKYVRKWKVVKTTRNESYDVPTLIGVNTGDQWPGGGEVYCTSLTDAPDGDSLMVRMITATYASPANAAGGGGGGGGGGGSSQRQPGRDMGVSPVARDAVVTYDFSYEMTSATGWYYNPVSNTTERPVALQPAGELVDGLQSPQPTTTITIAQYEDARSRPTLLAMESVGHLNDDVVSIDGIDYPRHTLLVKGISCRPVTEEWGGTTYKGVNVTYTIQARTNVQRVLTTLNADGMATDDTTAKVDIGWDIAVPLRGLNCKQKMSSSYPTDPFALQLHRDEEGIVFGDAQAAPPAVGNGEGPIRCVINGAEKSVYWGGTKFVDILGQQLRFGETVEGTIAKAMTTSPTSLGGFAQSPSSQAIPLNPDGTPRAKFDAFEGAVDGVDADYLFRGKVRYAEDAVLSYRRGIYPDVDFSVNFDWKGV